MKQGPYLLRRQDPSCALLLLTSKCSSKCKPENCNPFRRTVVHDQEVNPWYLLTSSDLPRHGVYPCASRVMLKLPHIFTPDRGLSRPLAPWNLGTSRQIPNLTNRTKQSAISLRRPRQTIPRCSIGHGFADRRSHVVRRRWYLLLLETRLGDGLGAY